MKKKARNFRNYSVRKDAVEDASCIYKVTSQMPWFEQKGICNQLQRAAVSMSSNIAKGCVKPSDADFVRCLDTSLGSAYQVETQLIISKNIGYINEEQYNDLIGRNIAIQHQWAGLIRSGRNE